MRSAEILELQFGFSFATAQIAKMNFIEFLLYFVLPALAAVYLFLKKKYSYFEEQGIPHLKPSLLFGNIYGVGSKIHLADLTQKIYDQCKGKDVIAGFYTLISPSIFVTDLELIKQITVKDFNTFVDRGVFVNEENEPLTGNLFSIEGEKWRFLRNKLSPTFTSGKIKMMYDTISDKGEGFVRAVEKASESGSVDIRDIASRFTTDIISNCAFGMEANTLNHENEDIVRIFHKIFGAEGQGIVKLLFLLSFPKFSKFVNLKQFDAEITKFFNDVIGGSVKHREENNIKRNDFLNMLIQLKNKGSIEGEISSDSRKLSMDELIAQACRF
jgi:cytochrome P450 family 6